MFSSRRSILLFSLCMLPVLAAGQEPTLIARMANNEIAARKQEPRFSYTSEERSPRTGGHLWKEKVVETGDGPLPRLIAVDGVSLTPSQSKLEADRINALASDPNEFRRMNASHLDDEMHAAQLLELLPRAFVITPAGQEHGCTRFAFRPNPSYEPSSYEERVVHAMGGTVSLQEPMDRLCDLDAKILQPVAFGYGLLGRVEQGGYFRLDRSPVDGNDWKSDRISVHVEGRVLMLKSLTRDQEITRTDIHEVSRRLSVAEAAKLTLP